MSQKETKILLMSFVITLLFLLGGGWLLWQFLNKETDNLSKNINKQTESEEIVTRDSQTLTREHISTGQQWLINENINPNKQGGITAFNNGNYLEAVSQLEAAIQQQPNDPEALIYLNNARIGQGQAYTIAVVIPVGSDVNVAEEILRGVAQAQNEINNNDKINGLPLKVVIANDNNEPELAIKIAEALASQNEIIGVIGHFSSDVTIAAKPVYDSNNLVVISPTSTSVALSGASQYLFRTVPSDSFTGNALVKYMLEDLGLTKAAIFYVSTSNYSNSLRNVVTTALFSSGGEVVFEFDFAETDFNPFEVIRQAQNRGAEALIFVSNSSNLDKALQIIQINEGRLAILGGDSMYNFRTLQLGRQNAVGMVIAIPWHIDSNRNSDFVQDSTRLWQGDVNWRTAMAYDATKALIKAIATNPTRTGVQQALSNPNFSTIGVDKDIRFLPSGDRNLAVQLVIIEPAPNTELGYRFFPLK